MQFSMILLAILCIITGVLLIPGIREVTLDPIVEAIINPKQYINLVIGGGA